MDRVPINPNFIAEALQLLASPACACDAAGVVFASNPALRSLFGGPLEGRLLHDFFTPDGGARVHVRDAARAEQQWEDQVHVDGQAMAVAYANLSTMHEQLGDETSSRRYAEMASRLEAPGGTLRR